MEKIGSGGSRRVMTLDTPTQPPKKPPPKKEKGFETSNHDEEASFPKNCPSLIGRKENLPMEEEDKRWRRRRKEKYFLGGGLV